MPAPRVPGAWVEPILSGDHCFIAVDIDGQADVVGDALLFVALVGAVVVATSESGHANLTGGPVADFHITGRNVDDNATGTAPRGRRGERMGDLVIRQRDRCAEKKCDGKNAWHVASLRLRPGTGRRP